MSTTARILKPVLADFAKELLATGEFKVYLPASDVKRVANGGKESVGTWFRFSREVDGKTCYASVEVGYFDAASFSMPIMPSTRHGSSMWVGDAKTLRTMEQYGSISEALTVENARLYASPFNSNPLVGRQANYADTQFAHLYQEVTA
jgi:hypothetical protein